MENFPSTRTHTHTHACTHRYWKQSCNAVSCWDAEKRREAFWCLCLSFGFFICVPLSLALSMTSLLKLTRQPKNNPPLERKSDGWKERGRGSERMGGGEKTGWWKLKMKRNKAKQNDITDQKETKEAEWKQEVETMTMCSSDRLYPVCEFISIPFLAVSYNLLADLF